MTGTRTYKNQLFKVLSMFSWIVEVRYLPVKMSKFLFSCLYSGKLNVYLRQSIHFSASGCSAHYKPILTRNKLEITDKHSADF